MSTKFVGYLAHPVGPSRTSEEQEARSANIRNALGWLRFLVDHTPWSISAPWLPYVMTLEEEIYRDRGIADDLAGLERCDLVVLCGGRISPGMEAEAAFARKKSIPVVDLTSLGYKAPSTDQASAFVAYRTGKAFAHRPRRVWIDPLSDEGIESLRVAIGMLRSVAGWSNGPVDEAIAFMSTLLERATVRPAS